MNGLGQEELFERLEKAREDRGLDIDEFVKTHFGIASHKYRDWLEGKSKPSKEVHEDMEKKLIKLEETR